MIYYDFIEKFINDLAEKCHIVENAVDRWNAIQMIQNLEGDGFTMVPFGQSFASMSGPTKNFIACSWKDRSFTEHIQFSGG